jgi:hypothetical protein
MKTMKTLPVLAMLLLAAVTGPAQPSPGQPHPPAPPPPVEAVKEPVNYLIRVEWREQKNDPKHLEILTTDGSFSLDTIQKNSVKIGDNEIPVTLKCSGSIFALSEEKGKLQLFLGRTVPYATGSFGGKGTSYSQMSVGLNSTFIVQFGKSQIIQSDDNGEISVAVKRVDK